MRGARGFSLVEILIVLTILGIAGAAVLPAMRDWAEEGAAGATRREITAVLTAARLEALGTGREVAITFDPGAATYRMEARSHAGQALIRQGFLDLPSGARLVSRSGPVTFEFSPVGPATGDGLTIETTEGTVRVTVDPWTGGIDADPR